MKHPLKAQIAGLFCAITFVAHEPDPKPVSLMGDIWMAARKGDLTALQQHKMPGLISKIGMKSISPLPFITLPIMVKWKR